MGNTASEQHGQAAPPGEAAMAAEMVPNPTTPTPPAPPPPQGLPSPPTATPGAGATGAAPPSLRGGSGDGGTRPLPQQLPPAHSGTPIVSASTPPTTTTPHNATPALAAGVGSAPSGVFGAHGQQPLQPLAAPGPLAAAAAAPFTATPNPFPHPGPPGGLASPPSPDMAAALAQEADPPACTLETGGLATPASRLRVQIFRVNASSPLRLDEEDRVIQHTLRPLVLREEDQRVVIETVGAVSFSDIATHMDSFKPHCVHFMGHGSEERLVLVDDDGQRGRYGAAEIATLFSTQPQCFLAVFNCCLSAPIARAVCEQGGVFATIGTSTKIGDSAALAFAKALWGGVLLKPLGAAFTQARLSRPYHLFQGSGPLSPPPTQGSQPPAQPAPADHIQLLQAMLREQYTSAAFTKIRILDHEANTVIQLEEIYTRLAIVDAKAQQVRDKGGKKAIQTRADLAVEYDTLYSPKQPSHIDHLFGKPGEPTSKRVLVAGRPGIGKTTLSRKIAHLWAMGHPPLTNRFDLVFRITLRGDLPATESMAELLHAVCLGSPRAFTLEQLDAALEQAGARVLLLLDGYDEFQAGSCPLLHRLIEGKLNPGFSVLITSRPAAAQQLMRSSSHHPFFAFNDVFELLGFSTAAIADYVGKYFAAKPATASGMVAYLEAHPTVQGAARVPIVAALLCILYGSHEEQGEAGELPSTLTGIFQGMVEYLLGRARLRLELKGDGDDEARLQAGLEFLEALAWEGMQQGRILFSREQVEAFAQPPHRVARATLELALQLGFLTTAESRHASEPTARVEYHFLHLTLQEFLAARHLQRTRRLEVSWWWWWYPWALVHVFEDRAPLRMVWQFGCGLLGADAGDLLRTIVATVKKDKRQALLALQCQAESGCSDLVGLLEGVFKDGRIDLSSTQLSAVELAAAVDVVKRFKIRVLDLSGNSGLGVSDADVLGPALRGVRAPEEVRVGGCGLDFIARLVHSSSDGLLATDVEMRIARAWGPRPASLDLSGKGIGPKAGAALAKVLRARTTLTSLDLRNNSLGPEAGAALAEALKGNTTLTSLDLSGNKLGPEAGAALAKALGGSPAIAAIDLSETGLAAEVKAAFAELLQRTRTILVLRTIGLGAAGWACLAGALKDNTTLTSLDLRNTNLGPEAGAALAEALKGNTTLTSLDLSWNQLEPASGAALAKALKGSPAIATIDLSSQGLSAEAAAALAELLQGTRIILELHRSSLGPAGWSCLAEALKDNTTLSSLDLSWNNLGPGGGAALAEALKGNTTLTVLNLSGNNLGPEAGAALAEALQGNTTLTSLDLSWNQLGPASGAALAKALKGSPAIATIDLSSKGLNAEAAAALAELLQGTRIILKLHRSSLGPAGWSCLVEALKGNTTLSSLDLRWNNLGPGGGAALAEALKGNTTLTVLNLSGNNLGPEGGAALAGALMRNSALTNLSLGHNDFSYATEGAIRTALGRRDLELCL